MWYWEIEIDRLRAELVAKDARIAEDREEHKLVLSSEAALRRENEALRKELAEVTADHKAMAEYALKLDASNDDYQAELATKDARIAALEDKHRTAEWSRDHERTGNEALRKELATKDARIVAAEAEQAHLQFCLNSRDDFIVNEGLWMKYVDTLPHQDQSHERRT